MAAFKLSKLCHSDILCRFTRSLLNICHIQKKSIFQTSVYLASAKPVKPVPPFFEYSHRTYQDERSRYPDLSRKEILEVIGEKFRSLDPEELEEMQADYRKRLDDYYEKLQEWKDSLTAEEIQQLEDMRRAKLELKQMRKERKLKRELDDKPKRPKSSYLLFCQDYKVKNQDASPTDQMKERAEAWRALSTAKRQVYKEKSMKLMAVYQEEMEDWEQEKIANEEFSKLRNSTKKLLKK